MAQLGTGEWLVQDFQTGIKVLRGRDILWPSARNEHDGQHKLLLQGLSDGHAIAGILLFVVENNQIWMKLGASLRYGIPLRNLNDLEFIFLQQRLDMQRDDRLVFGQKNG